ncbi:DUF1572 family protein, partial [Bacteroidota bacterium]
DDLFFSPSPEVNSISVIVQHMRGNMLSRWTDFLTSDGEKSWRNRDTEFEGVIKNRNELIVKWNEGWNCLFNTLKSLNDSDLSRTIQIRGENHSVLGAINRQLTHYSYHIGQIVFLGKLIRKEQWESLSVEKGKSEEFNKKMFKKFKEN